MENKSIFISYSRQDNKWLQLVKSHLEGIEHLDHKITFWDDSKLEGGDKWLPEIEKQIDKCSVALFLVSRHFVASEFIMRKELPDILKKADSNGTIIMYLHLEPSILKHTPLIKYQCMHDVGNTLSELHKIDENKVHEILVQTADKIITTLKSPSNRSYEGGKTKKELGIFDKMSFPLLILIYLERFKHQPIQIGDIAKSTNIPRKFVYSILEEQLNPLKYTAKTRKVNETHWTITEEGILNLNKFKTVFHSIED